MCGTPFWRAAVELQRLSLMVAETLDAPLTLKDLQAPLRALPHSKAPGGDGFPPEYYQAFSETLTQRLLEVVLEARKWAGCHSL
ncbi:hypothetical protein NDU88_004458 [Pleurodeles waltl]|uniref:Uncharacterized protein n=1 Tax=Pleurodeles waltl TaxID=8319 RepID=A0AAV7KXS9_PLEWA|nr:hypothetical protein NDU88_004458 [Pleurodeles waltl]